MLWPERPDNWRARAGPRSRHLRGGAGRSRISSRLRVGRLGGAICGARARCRRRCGVVELSSDDAWMRDTGPSFLVNAAGELRGVHWRFNAWGGLYRPLSAIDGGAKGAGAHRL